MADWIREHFRPERRYASSLHDRMTGPQRLDSGERWGCRRGKRDTPSPFHGVPSVDPPDPEVTGEGGKGLRMVAPKGTGSEVAVDGGRHGGGPGVLSTRVGCRATAERVRALMDEDRDEEEAWDTESEEGGPGPP